RRRHLRSQLSRGLPVPRRATGAGARAVARAQAERTTFGYHRQRRLRGSARRRGRAPRGRCNAQARHRAHEGPASGATDVSQGLPASRIEALSDGGFALAMTVLVLNIQVPDGGTSDDLPGKLLVIWPKLASYVMSFIMLSVLWIGHHFQFHYIRKTDLALLWINVFFLLAVTFLPFATGVLANYYRSRLA